MIKKDILDSNNKKIGEVEFPEGTPESEINAVLDSYRIVPEVHLPAVSPRQIRMALVLSGISLDFIDSAIASFPSPEKDLAEISWKYSITFERENELVCAVGQLLGWNSSQLDDLWKLAGTL